MLKIPHIFQSLINKQTRMIVVKSPSQTVTFPIHASPAAHQPTAVRLTSRFRSGFRSDRSLAVNSPVSNSEMELLRKLSRGCYGASTASGKKLEVESDSGGGEDVLASAAAKTEEDEEKLEPQHLVVMVNGLIGSSADWRYAAKKFVKKYPDKVIVHCSESNYSKLTLDGVDLMGERLAEEVLDVVKRRPKLRKISFVAHSLGGLVARYAVGRLYSHSPKIESSELTGNFINEEHTSHFLQGDEQPCEDRIAGLEPMNFITFATPHLGSRGHRQRLSQNIENIVADRAMQLFLKPLLPFLCGFLFLEKHASQTAHWIAGRSGKHLFLTDNDDGQLPLLLRMVTDSTDLKFMSALRSFRRRVAYANVNYDHIVGWSTASIRRQCELPKATLLVKDKKYSHISYAAQELAVTASTHTTEESFVLDKVTDLEEEMVKGLTQVPWERVDVNFRTSRQRFGAHNTIQVNTYWWNSDGAPVVFHMIDKFLL